MMKNIFSKYLKIPNKFKIKVLLDTDFLDKSHYLKKE